MVSLYSLIKLLVVAMSGEIHNHVEDLPFPNKTNNNNNADEKKTDESEDSNDSLQGLSCEICRVKVTSAKIFQRHLEGRKHKLRVERQGKQFKCDLCDIIANSEIQLEIHLRSAKHKARQHRKENPRWAIFHFLSSKISLLIFVTFVCILLNLFLLFKSFF
ncbi:unnamed protein product [Phyllotreta striolata]|uniref:Uncharacterized protein n=1 Tax=Phyllotreta striolata TaxID=444603 RepID=A0A9N9XMC0_PHYSR|nr:unnamed protein product [Phyllotreta striolata]